MAKLTGEWLHCRCSVYNTVLKETTGVETTEWDPFSIKLSNITAFKRYRPDEKEKEDEVMQRNSATVIWVSGDSYVIDVEISKLREYLKC